MQLTKTLLEVPVVIQVRKMACDNIIWFNYDCVEIVIKVGKAQQRGLFELLINTNLCINVTGLPHLRSLQRL